MDIIKSYRYNDFNSNPDSLKIKLLSRRLGVVSHYLSDYVCKPHAKRWTYFDNFKKHMDYERTLNEMAKEHDFKKNVIYRQRPSITELEGESLEVLVRDYIREVVLEEYLNTDGYENDLDFAVSLTANISYFIIDTVELLSDVRERELVLE